MWTPDLRCAHESRVIKSRGAICSFRKPSTLPLVGSLGALIHVSMLTFVMASRRFRSPRGVALRVCVIKGRYGTVPLVCLCLG